MKKTLIILITALIISIFSGCRNTNIDFPEEFISYGIDFSRYAKKDFLITTETYRGEYDGIALVRVAYIPENKAEKKIVQTWANKMIKVERIIGEINYDAILDSLCAIAIDKGADAIMNFRMTEDEVAREYILTPMITFKGFAIKRKHKNLEN